MGSKTGHYISIVAGRVNLSQRRTATEKSENAALLSSPARVHITTPTGSIPEPPEIRIPPYYVHTAVVPTVSALKGFHCKAEVAVTFSKYTQCSEIPCAM